MVCTAVFEGSLCLPSETEHRQADLVTHSVLCTLPTLMGHYSAWVGVGGGVGTYIGERVAEVYVALTRGQEAETGTGL